MGVWYPLRCLWRLGIAPHVARELRGGVATLKRNLMGIMTAMGLRVSLILSGIIGVDSWDEIGNTLYYVCGGYAIG